METPSFYSVTPATVRYDKNLKGNEKLLYGEITALTNKEGYCFATNKYFAELYGVSERSIREWISKLVKFNYLKTTLETFRYKDGTIKKVRKIFLTNQSDHMEVGDNHMEENFHDHMEENFHDHMEENFPYNNTSYILLQDKEYIYNENFSNSHLQKQNEKSQEIEEVQISEELSEVDENKNYIAAIGQKSKSFFDIFKNEITESFIGMLKVKYSLSDEQIKDIANNFILYRTEKNPNGKKERWEMEKTFDIKRRFYRWLNNDKRYNKRPQDKTGVVIIG